MGTLKFSVITAKGVDMFMIDRDMLGGPNMSTQELVEKAKELYNEFNPNDPAITINLM